MREALQSFAISRCASSSGSDFLLAYKGTVFRTPIPVGCNEGRGRWPLLDSASNFSDSGYPSRHIAPQHRFNLWCPTHIKLGVADMYVVINHQWMDGTMPDKIPVSIFLLKPKGVPEVEKLFVNSVPLTNGLNGLFVTFPSSGKEPAWFTAVREHIATGSITPVQGQSPAGMMLLKRGASNFALTFGHAWQYLELSWLEPDFGRRVALETISPDNMIEVDSEQVFAKFHNARERAPRATSIKEFGIESERDLVGVVEGEPSDPTLGKVIRGGTSLRVKTSLAGLNFVLSTCQVLFSRNTYHKNYPYIDNLMPVGDATLIDTLDKLLDNDLVSGKAKKQAVLVAPSFRRGDMDSADAFAFGRKTSGQATSPYLQYGSWEIYLSGRNETPSLEAAKQTKIHMFDEGGDIFETRNVYDCLGYETSLSGLSYVLSSGHWYSADASFTKSVEGALSKIPSPPYSLPAWDQIIDEDEYNRLCSNSGILLFDRKIVSFGGGHSKFEFCDFMDPKRRILFFAKITGRSCDSSHLVEQVNRTVELLFSSDNGFRKKLKSAMTKHYGNVSNSWLDQRPRPGDWSLCLVSMGRTLDKLPLFAKCSIARLQKNLDHAGHPLMCAAV